MNEDLDRLFQFLTHLGDRKFLGYAQTTEP